MRSDQSFLERGLGNNLFTAGSGAEVFQRRARTRAIRKTSIHEKVFPKSRAPCATLSSASGTLTLKRRKHYDIQAYGAVSFRA